jgi:hypothetical protein
VIAWLLGAALGPAAVAIPVNWAADSLAGAARRWFRRVRHADELSRLVRTATGTSVDLTQAEFEAVRLLLEDPRTWSVAGRGTVEELAVRIAACLPTQDGRTPGDSHAAAMTIARGLLEFAVADLDPGLFQRLLLTRLDRMEADQASALDEALLGMHADLVARLDAHGELDAQRFADVMGQFKQMLDRLPPGPAYRGEIVAYLKTLIDWLNTDPWPQDRRFGGPVLTPAAIERELRVVAADRSGEQHFDADDLTERSRRLLILGGPGSGKTWLAKRTARRCAENAVEALAAGATLDEVELPLYTTCARLVSADGDVRAAAVSSALDQLGDLGGSRLSRSLRLFFTERNAPTVLVIDSLDEASGSDERLRQADTLPWRIILTSRPSSWNQQLVIEDGNSSHHIGELEPLRYPDDVESFIERWFGEQPERGKGVAAQIAQQPGLRQSATVPLILAFYCIVGANEPLPQFRHDLYTRVIRRMLTGRWRGSNGRRLHVDACMQTLRAWAWAGTTSHPVSGVGMWVDDIATGHVLLGEAEQDALDNVAPPVGLPDVDTGQTMRRFCHRSIREHLVAEHVAGLPADRVAGVLLPHVWFDPDWEYSAAAALAMHPQRDQILRDLICQAAQEEQVPQDLSGIDGSWQFRKFLVRVAADSSEADWSSDMAAMIGRARAQAAEAGKSDPDASTSWETSSRPAKDEMLRLLANETNRSKATSMAYRITALGPTAEDKRRVCGALLSLLARETYAVDAYLLTRSMIFLDPTPEESRQANDVLLRFLTSRPNTVQDSHLVGNIVKLATTVQDKQQAREVLLSLLARDTDASTASALANTVARLSPTAEDKQRARGILLRLLANKPREYDAKRLLGGMAKLATTAEDKRLVRDALLGILADQPSLGVAELLVSEVARLVTTATDKRLAREALLGLLAGPARRLAAPLVRGVVALNQTSEDRQQARALLLSLLASSVGPWTAPRLAEVMAELNPTAQDKQQARKPLLLMLSSETNGYAAWVLADRLAQLDPTSEDTRQARGFLLALLSGQTDLLAATKLVDGVVKLAITAEDKRLAREALLGLLADQQDRYVAEELASGIAQLDPTADEKYLAQEPLLQLLGSQTRDSGTRSLVDGVVKLAITAEDKRLAREALLGLLADQQDRDVAAQLAAGIARLDVTAKEKAAVWEMLLKLLDASDNASPAGRVVGLVRQVVELATTAQDKQQARDILLGMFARMTSWRGRSAEELMVEVGELEPTVRDLRIWGDWASSPTTELLAAVRQNTILADWLDALPLMTSLQKLNFQDLMMWGSPGVSS